MVKLGVTGGIGSGKSVVTKLFALLGVPVYDADSKARFLMENNEALRTSLMALFGVNVYSNHHLNRKFLASQVFENAPKLAQLNGLVHPAVATDFEQWLTLHQQAPMVVKEAAIMFESDTYKSLDKIITVFAPEEIRLQRVLKRDPQRTESEVRAIMSNQFPEEKKLKLADYVIFNDDKHLVIPQVIQLYQTLTKQAQ